MLSPSLDATLAVCPAQAARASRFKLTSRLRNERPDLEYAEIITAAVGALLLAAAADLLTGRRGLLATSLVSATGAVCGWFLAVRVFALAITDSWTWVPWAMGGAVFCLLAFFLFRSKR